MKCRPCGKGRRALPVHMMKLTEAREITRLIVECIGLRTDEAAFEASLFLRRRLLDRGGPRGSASPCRSRGRLLWFAAAALGCE